jgi:mono/diheme cytochrome c family protein
VNRLQRTAAFIGLAATAVAATGSLIQQATARQSSGLNPFAGSDAARRAGAKVYERECASCHGMNREGGVKAPPLARPEVFDATPGALFWILRNGSLRRGMPSFAHLPEATRWQIITFLQSRSGQ